MSAYAVPFAIPKQPRSLLQPTRRDFATTAGDDFTIEITVYPTDADTSPYDVTGATSAFVVYDDSSREVLEVAGTVADGAAGRLDIDVDGDDTTELAGRYSFRVTVEFADGTSTVIHGAVHVASRAGSEMISGSGSLPSSTVLDLTEVTIATATITKAEIGDLTVTGSFVGEGTGSFGGNLSVTGNITATGDISAGGSMAVTGDITSEATVTGLGFAVKAFGTSTAPTIAHYRGRGTAGSPTSPQGNDVLAEWNAAGYASGVATTSRAAIKAKATQNWTDSAQGTGIDMLVTAKGSTTPTTVAEFTTTGITLASRVTPSDGVTSMRVEAGAYEAEGAYDYATAPFQVRMTLPRVDGASVPLGNRDIMRIQALNDQMIPRTTADGAPSISRLLHITHVLGKAGGAVADQWDGNRATLLVDLTDAAPPSTSTSGLPFPLPAPEMICTWLGTRTRYSRGGIGLGTGRTRGRVGTLYTSTVLDEGAANLTAGRAGEHGFLSLEGSSVRNWRQYGFNVMGVEGVIPARMFSAIGAARRGQNSPGWLTFLSLGESGFPGIDEIYGTIVGFRASNATARPRAAYGLDLLDGQFSSPVMRWSGGAIEGGLHTDNTTGRLRIGGGYIERSSTGVSIDVRGWVGPAPGTKLRSGTEITTSNAGMLLDNSTVFECSGGGTYVLRSRDPSNAAVATVVEVLNSPVYASEPSGAVDLLVRPSAGGLWAWVQNDQATTTVHPSKLTETEASEVIGGYLRYETGVCAGEMKLITGYNTTTKEITTEAFSQVPTADVNFFTNPNFQLNLSVGWTTGGSGSVVKSGNTVILTGTGSAAAWIEQSVTVTEEVAYLVRVRAAGPVQIDISLTSGGTPIQSILVEPPLPPSEDEDAPTVFYWSQDVLFQVPTGATSVVVRFGNILLEPSTLVFVAGGQANTSSFRSGVRCAVVRRIQATIATTQKTRLDLQSSGGSTVVGGDLTVGSSKLTVAAASGNTAIAGTLGITGATTAAAITASGAVTANGAGTGLAVTNNATIGGTLGVTGATTAAAITTSGDVTVGSSKVTMAAATGNTAIAGTLGVTGASTVAALTTSGDVTVGSSKVTMAAASGNTAIAGTLGVTGATTVAALTTSGDVTVGSSKVTVAASTGDTAIAGTLAVTGATTAAAVTASGTVTGATFVPSSASAPTNGLYLPSANTLGLAINSAAEVQLTSSALSPAANDGNALGTTSLSWSDLFLASGGVVNFNAGNATITHSTGALAFGVAAASFTGTLDAAGNFSVATSKFTVTASNGNTSVGGTFGVTGATTLSSTLAVTGTSTMTGALTVNNTGTFNSTGTSIASLQGTMIYAAAADGSITRVTIDAAANVPYVQFRRYDGTYASPSAVASAASLGTIAWRGYTGSAMSTERGYIEAVAAEAWSTSANGVHIDFGTTTTGSVSNASRRMRLTADGKLLIGTTTASAELTVTGNVWWSGYSLASVGNALTATGTTRTDALQLSKEYNRLTTVASGTGVILPTGVVGMAIVLFNAGANVVKVYANGSETIDGTAGSTGVNLTNGLRCVYIFVASNTWVSAQLGAVSA